MQEVMNHKELKFESSQKMHGTHFLQEICLLGNWIEKS